jgi:2-polyprenyl-3-methyl-5-hydroxy-6-metoxy-1,4-benzoquinol methylase
VENFVYQDMTETQQNHWWYKARQVLLKTILHKYLSPGPLTILEIGCGTGGNLSMLKKYGTVFAMEMDSFAADYAAKHSNSAVKIGWLPDNIPFKEKFDVICLFDVLEHVEDDKTALLKITQLLNPCGIIILTVPAHQWLYGTHDKMHHHFRRYSSSALRKIIPSEDMEIIKRSHFNFILFPFLVLSRLMDKKLKPEKSSGYQTPEKFINAIFFTLFSLEKHLINRINVPFGGSAYLILKTKHHE